MKDIVKLTKLIQELGEYDTIEDTPESRMLNKIKSLAEEHYVREVQKKAQEISISEPKKVDLESRPLMEFLACLKLNLTYIQAAHWISKGKSFYGDHLLFERIYNELAEEIDAYAEKVLALSGDETVNPIDVLSVAAERLPKIVKFSGGQDGDELAKYAINSEKYVLAELEKLYHTLKEQDKLTLGFDDMLMSMHNNHENHIYLIQQRAK
jgi:starvation-inducible DNA-binding protein